MVDFQTSKIVQVEPLAKLQYGTQSNQTMAIVHYPQHVLDPRSLYPHKSAIKLWPS